MPVSKVLIATHAVLVEGQSVHGPAHILYDFLHDRGVSAQILEFPLTSGIVDWPRQVKHVIDVARRDRPSVYIGIDPLNGWAGRELKRRGIVDHFVYHTPDYSPQRFGFAPLNWLYHWIDRQVLSAADDCWTVSARITEVRQQQGRSDARTIVNGIRFDERRIPPLDANRRFRLILVGNLNQTMDLEMLFGVITELRADYPSIHLDIVGDGKGRSELERRATQLTIEKNVTFHGNQPLDQVLKLLQTAGIGIALYSGTQGFNYYGDSKKIREYSAIGLPVITTEVVVNAQEIKGAEAGLIVEPSSADVSKALCHYFDDQGLYERERSNAIELARKTDINTVLEEAFRSIGVLS